MVRTESTMSLALGASAPDFSLLDVNGNTVSLADVEASPGLLVAFICNHCPFVKHIREGFADFAREYSTRGLAVLAINSNDVETHAADSPEAMKIEAAEAGFVASDTALYAAAARRRRGQLLGGEEGKELVAAADTWMRSEGIVRPDRVAAMIVPGCAPAGG